MTVALATRWDDAEVRVRSNSTVAVAWVNGNRARDDAVCRVVRFMRHRLETANRALSLNTCLARRTRRTAHRAATPARPRRPSKCPGRTTRRRARGAMRRSATRTGSRPTGRPPPTSRTAAWCAAPPATTTRGRSRCGMTTRRSRLRRRSWRRPSRCCASPSQERLSRGRVCVREHARRAAGDAPAAWAVLASEQSRGIARVGWPALRATVS